MGIQIVHFLHQSNKKWGVVKGDSVLTIEKDFETLSSLLEEGIDNIKRLVDHQKGHLSLDEIEFLSPVTQPARIVCQGANYGSHRAESGLEAKRPPFNLIFHKSR